jgi:uncharacterized damage-inducible protein DinB
MPEMHPSVTPLAAVYRLNTELLVNCVQDMDDDQAAARITGSTNSIGFLVAHLADTRHYLAALLQAPLPNPLPPAFAQAKTMDEAGPLPPLADLLRFWEAISAHLAVEVERLDTPALARAAAQLPGSDGTVLGALAFLAQHESYHLGQIALLRRQLGLPAMSYAMAPREPGRRGA